ncbi:MAG TPA: glycosyltransferase family 9 protein [Ktedonobacteraceae bacterium]|nr:glycosyltransferase family 9 protein [Ktedonobacteraceae bacterium]
MMIQSKHLPGEHRGPSIQRRWQKAPVNVSPWQPPSFPVRRIAIFRALYLGDLLLAIPALRAIRAGFPEAEITLIGLSWAASFAWRFHHYIDRFVEFAGYPGIREVAFVPEQAIRFLLEQRAYGYDLVIQMHGSGRTSDALAIALGGRVTVGYYEGEQPAGLTLGLPYPDNWPEVFRNLGLAYLLGCPNGYPELEFPLLSEDRLEAAVLLRGLSRADRPWVGIHTGARAPARRWPAEYFAAVADALARRFDAQIILTGSKDEITTVQEVEARMTARALNVAGQTSLGGLAALISKLDLFITNDTGPSHIASAVDTPSITLFGPVDPRRWASRDRARHPILRLPVSCSPCPYRECPIDHRCLRWITPDMVLAQAEDMLLKGTVNC